jgi:hypothetical protein
LLANPNNPDGRIVARDDLRDWHDRLMRRDGWLVVDEAFADAAPQFSVSSKVGQWPRLITLRSFGKFFGLAGLRLGFVLAPPEVTAMLRAILGDWPLSAGAIAMGRAAYQDAAWIAQARRDLAQRATQMDRLLAGHGLKTRGACPHFRLIEDDAAQTLFNTLAQAHILSRPFDYAPIGCDWAFQRGMRISNDWTRCSPMGELFILGAMALDLALGWPGWLYRAVGHPVGLFAWLIDRARRYGNRARFAPGTKRVFGILTVAMLVLVAGGGAWGLQNLAQALPGSTLWLAILAWPGLAMRSLDDHVRAVWRSLKMGDEPQARRAVGMIVGRDTAQLDADGVARAAIESLAELCDGIAAPLFWLVALGLPGLWVYKALNTADSMIGHPEPDLRDFGWAARAAMMWPTGYRRVYLALCYV